MNINKWIGKNCNSLKNKRVVVTGATGGLGRELCFYLARLEADITLACRNKKSAEKLINDIKIDYPCANIDFVELDLINIKSVKNCLKKLKKYKGIDILINNAGVYNVPIKKLELGYNNIFQINFVSTYYLTKQLLSELEKKENSMCITIGSIAHNYSKINKSDIDFSSCKKASKIYGNSKRFLMFSSFELFKTTNVKLAIVHPGITLTNMTSHYPKAINWFVKCAVGVLFPRPKRAALNVLYALNNCADYHEWIGPSLFDIWGKPKIKKLSTCSVEESKTIFNIAENIIQKIK